MWDKALKTAIRQRWQPQVRAVRKQIKKSLLTASLQEAEQLAVLDDYATGILTALNTDGLPPFQYATVQAGQMLEQLEASLQQLLKKGDLGGGSVREILARLQARVAARADWAEQLAQVQRLHGWQLAGEPLLDRSRAKAGEVVNTVRVGIGLDHWRERMSSQLRDGSLSQLEQEGRTACFQGLSNLRSHLVQCYDHQDCPRTNNDRERSLGGLKTPSRRVSGRKNWQASLWRYGRLVAYAAWWEQDTAHPQSLERRAGRLDRSRWRALRRQRSHAQREQLIRFRFRHKRQSLLTSLETRWATATQSVPLP